MVTGTTRLSSLHTWVMPTFSPTIAFVAIPGLAFRVHNDAPLGRTRRSVSSVLLRGSCRQAGGRRHRLQADGRDYRLFRRSSKATSGDVWAFSRAQGAKTP